MSKYDGKTWTHKQMAFEEAKVQMTDIYSLFLLKKEIEQNCVNNAVLHGLRTRNVRSNMDTSNTNSQQKLVQTSKLQLQRQHIYIMINNKNYG